jgi:hypothetical protein
MQNRDEKIKIYSLIALVFLTISCGQTKKLNLPADTQKKVMTALTSLN